MSLFVSDADTIARGVSMRRHGILITDSHTHKRQKDALIKSLAAGYIQGLSVLGGEPFEPEKSAGSGETD